MTAQDAFARVWYLGLALAPMLLLAGLSVRRLAEPARRSAVLVAVLAALGLSTIMPVLREPGALLEAARANFHTIGLAPCKAQAPVALTGDGCLTMRWGSPWLFGCTVLLAWHLLGILGVRRLRAKARPPTLTVEAEVRAAAQLLGIRPPAVAMLERRGSPMVVGILEPALLLPASLWARLDPDAREAILLHELAHLRRRDLSTMALCQLIRSLFWWHPLVWWLRIEAARAAELACDLTALRARPDHGVALARALLEVERDHSTRRSTFPLFAARALSPAARDLSARLRVLAGERPPQRRTPTVPTVLAAFTAVASAGWVTVQVALG